MGRGIKPAWYYKQQMEQAEARENYFKNRPAPVPPATVNDRGPSTTLFYRSLLLKNGTDPVIFRVNVLNATVGQSGKLGVADVGLLETLPANTMAFPTRGSGINPTKVYWQKGDTTPTRQTTDWGTKWTRYYDPTPGSSGSSPFSKASGTFDAGDLQTAFNGLFGANGTKRSLLGTENGRAWLEYERMPVSANS